VYSKHDVSDEDKILIKNLYQLTGYKAMELTNRFSNKCSTKSSINRLLKKFGDTVLAQLTDSQIAADHKVPAVKKILC